MHYDHRHTDPDTLPTSEPMRAAHARTRPRFYPTPRPTQEHTR